jgi:hypothetical protein
MGNVPINAFRTISSDRVRRGEVCPNPSIVSWLCQGDYSWLVRQCAYYCSELERERKYALYVWPPHCLLGSDGHSLAGVIHEARLFHSFVCGSQAIPDGHGGFVADFTPEIEVAFERFQRGGMHVVRSTDPLESWPDLTF